MRDEKNNEVTYYCFQIRIVPIDEYYKILKRHSEFESLYEALCMTFAQLVFVKPPSKLKFLHKVKRRKEFYLELLFQIKNYMTTYPDYKELFLQKIFQFFIVNSKIMEEKDIKREVDVKFDKELKREHTLYSEESFEDFHEDLNTTANNRVSEQQFDRSAVYNNEGSLGLKVNNLNN